MLPAPKKAAKEIQRSLLEAERASIADLATKKQHSLMPHFHECQDILGDRSHLSGAQAEVSPPGNEILTPRNEPADFSQGVTPGNPPVGAGATPTPSGQGQQSQQEQSRRPFRSVSPIKTLQLLREAEALKPRSEQHFLDTVEKEMSSSEESSPMYLKFRQKKIESERLNQQALKKQQALAKKLAEEHQKRVESTGYGGKAAQSPDVHDHSSNNDRSTGVPQRNLPKSDHDGATEAQNSLSPEIRAKLVDDEERQQPARQPKKPKKEEEDDCSMDSAQLEAESRGFHFLHLLASNHRNDALEISQLNKPPIEENAPPVNRAQATKNRVRGKSFLQQDMKTRKKEKLVSVFALSDSEWKEISDIRSRRSSIAAAKSAKPIKPTQSSFSIKLQLADSPVETRDQRPPGFQSRRSADHAKMVNVKGVSTLKGSFHLPIQACEKIDSSSTESAANEATKKQTGSGQKTTKNLTVNSSKNLLKQRKSMTIVNRMEHLQPAQSRLAAQASSGKKQIQEPRKFGPSADKKGALKLQKPWRPTRPARPCAPQGGPEQSSQNSSSDESSSSNASPAESHNLYAYFDYEAFNRKLQVEGGSSPATHYQPAATEQSPPISKSRQMPPLQMSMLVVPNQNGGSPEKRELLSQRSPSPRQPSIREGYSPDRDGGHTERNENKGRTIRFNLQECDYLGSSTNEQLSVAVGTNPDILPPAQTKTNHRPTKTWTSVQKTINVSRNIYQAERSFDDPALLQNTHLQPQQQPPQHPIREGSHYDTRSMACQSESKSEHYIKAKKFAELRSNTSKKSLQKRQKPQQVHRQPSASTSTKKTKHDSSMIHGPSPPQHGADTSSLQFMPQESELLRSKPSIKATKLRKANFVDVSKAIQQSVSDLAIQNNKFSEPLSSGLRGAQLKKQKTGPHEQHVKANEERGFSSHMETSDAELTSLIFKSPMHSKAGTVSHANLPVDDQYFYYQGAVDSQSTRQRKRSRDTLLVQQTKDSLKVTPNGKKSPLGAPLGAMLQAAREERGIKTGEKPSTATRRQLQDKKVHQTVTSNNLEKMSQNFHNLASNFSDHSSDIDVDEDTQAYIDSYLKLLQNSPDTQKGGVSGQVQTGDKGRQVRFNQWVNVENMSQTPRSSISGPAHNQGHQHAHTQDKGRSQKSILHNGQQSGVGHANDTTRTRTATQQVFNAPSKASKDQGRLTTQGVRQSQTSTKKSKKQDNFGSHHKSQGTCAAAVQNQLVNSAVSHFKENLGQQADVDLLTLRKCMRSQQQQVMAPQILAKPALLQEQARMKAGSPNPTRQKAGGLFEATDKPGKHLVSDYLDKAKREDQQVQGGRKQTQVNQNNQMPRVQGKKINIKEVRKNQQYAASSNWSPDDELREAAQDSGFEASPGHRSGAQYPTIKGDVMSLSPPSKHALQGAMTMLASEQSTTGRRNANGYSMGNYLSHNDRLMLANHEKQQRLLESQHYHDARYSRQPRNPPQMMAGQDSSYSDHHRLSDNGAAYFGGASSSGGGAVLTGPHLSAAGLSPPAQASYQTMRPRPAFYPNSRGQKQMVAMGQQPGGDQHYEGEQAYSEAPEMLYTVDEHPRHPQQQQFQQRGPQVAYSRGNLNNNLYSFGGGKQQYS